jgi:hypothetical protein
MQAASPKTTMGRISFLVNVASSASPRPTTGIHPPYLRRLRIRISPSRSVWVTIVVASVSPRYLMRLTFAVSSRGEHREPRSAALRG